MAAQALDGFLVLDKPEGVTSARALDPLKERVGRVGHAGTLDPFASGALLALVGEATRLNPLAMSLHKIYRAWVVFGRQTDTLDPTGRVIAEAGAGQRPPGTLDAALASQRGEIIQVPPEFSALKVGGERAYHLARQGKPVALTPRKVLVHRLEVVEERWPELLLEIECGAGTYIRSIARDLGTAVGLPASLLSLRRTRIGPFEPTGEFLPMERLLVAAGYRLVELEEERGLPFAVGMPVPGVAPAGRIGVLCNGLVGIGMADDAGILRASTILASARRRLEA